MPVRKYRLELDNGQTIPVEAEDTYTPDEVMADALKRYPNMVQLVPLGRDLKSAVSAGGQALARGGLSSSGFLIDAATMIPRFSNWMRERGEAAVAGQPEPEFGPAFPQGQRLEQAFKEFLPRPRGGSALERYSLAGAEGVGGAATTGPVRGLPQALWNLLTGGAAGVAVQGAKEAETGPLGELGAAGAVAGLSALGARKFNPNAAQLARETLEGVDPANLQVGIQRMEDARAGGVPINLSQGMMAGSNIDDMVEFLANSRFGDQTISQLRAQPGTLQLRGRVALDNLPGRASSMQDVSNRAQEGATKALKAAERRASSAYVAKLPPGTKVPTEGIQAFEGALDNYIASKPNVDAQGLAEAVKRALIRSLPEAPEAKPVGRGLVSGKVLGQVKAPPPPEYLDDANQLKEAVENVLQRYGRNMQNTDAVRSDLNRYAQEIRALFDRTVAVPGSPMREARAAARTVYQQDVNPLRKGPVGRVAGVRGALEEKEAALGPLKAILQRGTPRGSNSEILRLEASLRQSDPGLFPDVVKTYLAERLDKVLKTSGTRPDKEMAGSLKSALADTPDQMRGLEDMLAGVARSQGLPEQVVVDGFMNFVELAEMAARQPRRISGLPARDIFEVGGQSLPADIAQVQYFSGIGRKIRQLTSRDAYRTIDRLLTTPEGVRALQELAEKGPQNPSAAAALAAFMGAAGQNSAQNIPE